MISNILIIGCGNIGYRHLQGILKSKKNINIFIIEKNAQQRNKISKEIISKNISKNSNIQFVNNIKKLANKFNNVIVATSNVNRLNIVTNLLKYSKFKNIIIEKVAFRNLNEAYQLKTVFKKKKIQCWVNCPRRNYNYYKKINKIIDKNKFKIIVKGHKWGMASNTIHFIDLFLFLSNGFKKKYLVKIGKNKIIKSKRKGFYEVIGKFEIFNNNGSKLELNDDKKYSENSNIVIEDKINKFIINETEMKLQHFKNNKLIASKKIKIPLVSESSAIFAEHNVSKINFLLPKINESIKSHKILFDLIKKHNKIYKNIYKNNIFKIT